MNNDKEYTELISEAQRLAKELNIIKEKLKTEHEVEVTLDQKFGIRIL